MPDGPCVGIDCWPATTHAPGVGRYARELIRALARLEQPPCLGLFDVGPRAQAQDCQPLGIEPLPAGWRRLEADLPRRALGPLAALGLTADRLLGGCALFHRVLVAGPPVGALPQVLALSELPAPGTVGEAELRRALRAVRDVVVFSAHARGLVSERFGLDPERVHALPVGCDHWIRAAPPLDTPQDPPVVLALGRVDAARGHLVLLQAFERLDARTPSLRLVFCGRPGAAAGELARTVAASPACERVRWIDRPVERDLAHLMARAAVLVHLSSGELTPVTPLEGLAAGAALVASPLPAFREVLGEQAHWVAGEPASLDSRALAPVLEAALASGLDPLARRRRRELAAPFTWERHARLTAELWSRILAD